MTNKPLTLIEQAEAVIGPRPNSDPATETTGCAECQSVYQPGKAGLSVCPKCANQGHLYRLKNAAESEWFARFYEWLVSQGQDWHRLSVERNRAIAGKLAGEQ